MIGAKIRESENRLVIIASSLKSLYEDKCGGKIPEAVFLSLMDEFVREQAEIEERLPRLRIELDSLQDKAGDVEEWLSLISSCLDLETLDRATVMGLVESIAVSERVKQWDRKQQELEITYRFIGKLPTDAKEDIA